MKNKHKAIPAHSALFKKIRKAVHSQIKSDPNYIKKYVGIKFLVYFTIITGFYLNLFYIENPWWFTLNFIGLGITVLLICFNFAHDLSHDTVFKKKKWNYRCYVAVFTLAGAHAAAWKERHIHAHHFAPNVLGYDSDLEISNWIRVIPGSSYFGHHRLQHLYAPFTYMVYSLFWVFVKDFVILFSEENKNKPWKYYLVFGIQKITYLTYILVFPLIWGVQSVWVVLFAFLAMHLIQSFFLLFTFFITHHVKGMKYPQTDNNGIISTSWLDNQVGSSNDFHPFSDLANFIFGGFNNHIAHHLFPHIHHVYYPRLNKILYKELKANGISPNKTTYWGGVKNHLLHLKELSIA